MLQCEDPNLNKGAILRAFRALGEGKDHGRGPFSTAYEHGQHWVLCLCGAGWSVVDAEGPGSHDGLGFEQVSDGEDGFHDED